MLNYIQVQIRNWLCAPHAKASCACAVVVQERDVVLGIDMCSDNTAIAKRVTVVNYQKHRILPPGAGVTRDPTGREFLVCIQNQIRIDD